MCELIRWYAIKETLFTFCLCTFLCRLLSPPAPSIPPSRLICFVLFFQISDYGNCWQIVLHLDFLLFPILVWFLPFRPHPIHPLRRMLYVLWYSALALWLHTACSSLHASFSAPSNGFLFILISSTKRQCHIRHCFFDFTSSFFVVAGSCFLNFFPPSHMPCITYMTLIYHYHTFSAMVNVSHILFYYVSYDLMPIIGRMCWHNAVESVFSLYFWHVFCFCRKCQCKNADYEMRRNFATHTNGLYPKSASPFN